MDNTRKATGMALMLFLAFSCTDDPVDPTAQEAYLAGGETTIFDATSMAYQTPAPNLSPTNFDRHMDGDFAFDQVFVTEPATLNPGLGPVFNNTSCASCHVRNGRAAPPADGSDLSGFLMRLSVAGSGEHGGPAPVPDFGTQLQTRANFGLQKEADLSISYIDEVVEFLDGTSLALQKPVYEIENPYRPLPAGMMTSPRVAPPVFGLGLLEAIPEADLLALADEGDANGDGISGKANYGYNPQTQQSELGRFGWKAAAPSALVQTADAFHQDMGVTSPLFPAESCEGQDNCQGTMDNEPDIDSEFLETTTFYFQTLAVPAPRNLENGFVEKGRQLFAEANCSGCHVPKHLTGTGAIPELSNQTIYPYTDLLLHDMGEGLADNRPDYLATGREWRTPPLWGIGLTEVVNGHSRFLHDGRARNLTEAILWHGGEAEASKEFFRNLNEADKEALIAFLRAL